MDKSTKIAAIALITLALSIVIIIHVPSVHHPEIVDGAIADNFPPFYEVMAYLVSIVALPASAIALVIVFAFKAKKFVSNKQKNKG